MKRTDMNRYLLAYIEEKQWKNTQQKQLPNASGKKHDVEGRGMETRRLWVQSVPDILLLSKYMFFKS